MTNAPIQTNPSGSVGSVGSMNELLNMTREWFARFIYIVNETDLDVIALWTVHTWLCEETYTTPRLLIDSPVPGSGKTTLLEHLGKLSRRSIQMASISSAPLLARITAKEIRTLLLDEADRSLDPKRPGVQDLIAILNSGYKVGATRPVLVKNKEGGWDPDEMPTFAPVAIAGNTPLLPDDTRSRCITVRLLPALEGGVEPSDWEYLDSDARALAEVIEATADQFREQVRHARPILPDGCVNRLRERWNPLKRIAWIAGEEWSTKVDELIIEDIQSSKEQAENAELHVSLNMQLAKDLLAVFSGSTGFVPTTKLVPMLISHNPETWSFSSNYGKDLTVQRLGQLLHKAFGVNSRRVGDSSRGYNSIQFEKLWRQLGLSHKQPTELTEPTEPAEPSQGILP
jgi:hypothetical protein